MSNIPNAFTVNNYRAFATEQRIVLRPLTLFFGWNSGGKSSLLRFLPLIAESLAIHSRPIWLGGSVARRAPWSDLVCKVTESAELRFSLEWEDNKCSKATWSIVGDLNGAWQEVRQLTLNGIEHTDQPAFYQGLLPLLTENIEEYSILREKLKALPLQVQWLQGLRKKPERLTFFGGGSNRLINPDGSDAIDRLIEAHQDRRTEFLEEIQDFFKGLGETLSLDNPVNGAWRIMLCPQGQPATRVDLCDTGEGYSQVLPVLIALAECKYGGANILCLEQPELHLHTRAQAQLAQQLVSAASGHSSPRIMVETHSEVLLSSIQLAIVQKKLKAEDVQVYWVESREDGTGSAMPVTFNEIGEPDNSILSGAFREALNIGQQLMDAQFRNLSIPAQTYKKESTTEAP